MDRRLHDERLDGRAQRRHRRAWADLPAGSFVVVGEVAHLVLRRPARAVDRRRRAGYGVAGRPARRGATPRVLTPPSTDGGARRRLPTGRSRLAVSDAGRTTDVGDIEIRLATDADRDALYDICLRTGDAGEDASGVVNDPRLLGELFVAPYAALEPELSFVAVDDEGVAGYVVGTADTRAFEARQEAEWFPALRARYPKGPARASTPSLVALIHDPVRADDAVVAGAPRPPPHRPAAPGCRAGASGRG